MLKAIFAIIGMLATGFIVWKLLERQGNATDAKGNIIGDKSRHNRSTPRDDDPPQ